VVEEGVVEEAVVEAELLHESPEVPYFWGACYRSELEGALC
jgi:hypothetical protein